MLLVETRTAFGAPWSLGWGPEARLVNRSFSYEWLPLLSAVLAFVSRWGG
jgi:hypothetical protein